MNEQAMQDKSVIKRKIKLFGNRLSYKVWFIVSPVASWIYFKWFYKELTGKGIKIKLYWGFKELLWCYICGDSIWYSFHVANIYWGIGK